MRDIDEARDWRGQEVNCSACPHKEFLDAGRCELRKACVQDRYARRIDRFFHWNPELADSYLTHPHFEVRAIAAKFANPFLLPGLLKDPDETVRWEAVRRLPLRYQLALRDDPHREVRIRIVSLLQGADLQPMLKDADYYVRIVVARKIGKGISGAACRLAIKRHRLAQDRAPMHRRKRATADRPHQAKDPCCRR